MAHGALLENILIASSALGYKADINTFPDKDNSNHVASITLNKTEIREGPLYPFIKKRATNRKPYYPDPLTNEEKASLLELNKSGFGKVKLLEGEKAVEELADTLCLNERLVFENQQLHKFFFEHMRLTKKEALEKRDGMYIKTMELPPPVILLFKLVFKRWKLVKALGISKFIAKQTKKMYLAAPAIGIITIDSDSSADFLAGGRLMQRVWLEATRMGLSLHPSAGTICLIQRVLK
ncbi:MAG: nitroreductase, partial [Thermodesulfobacteriota bacterium]